MSKIGAHVTGEERNGYGEYCTAKPRVVIAVNQGGALEEAKANSGGHTYTIFRDTTVYPEAPGDINNSQATFPQMAAYWYPQLREKWRQNPADAYCITNEQGGNEPDGQEMHNLVAYEREVMKLANADGLKVCVLNLAGGTPGDIEKWKEIYAPFIKEAMAAGNVYGRHAYGENNVLVPPDGNAGRPFAEADYLKSIGANGGIVVTECGFQGGYDYVGTAQFVEQTRKYDIFMRNYDNIIGFCMWELGDTEFKANWQNALPETTHWLLNNPTPKWGTPEEKPEPVMASGIDVSKWQGNMNWLKAARSGAEFAFIRIASTVAGRLTKDPYFDKNWAESKVAGVPRGAYYYFSATKDPREQAAYFANLLPDDWELPPVADIEDTHYSGGGLPERAKVFLDTFESLVGVKPTIYTGAWYWNPHIGYQSWANEYDLWTARYSTSPNPLPMGWDDWAFWQFSSKGNGADYGASSTYIDLNWFNGTSAELEQYIENARPKPPQTGCMEIPPFTRTFLIHPQYMSDAQADVVWAAISPDFGIAVDGEIRAVGESGWSVQSGLQIVKDAVTAGKDGSRLLILDGHNIGDGLTPEWIEQNCPDLLDKTRWYVTGDSPEPPKPSKIDLKDYIIGDGRRYYLAGPNFSTQELLQSQHDPTKGLYYQTKNQAWESFVIDDNWIRRDTDTSPGGGRFYTQREGGVGVPARWLPRNMAVGEDYTGTIELRFFWLGTCAQISTHVVTDTRKLVKYYDRWTSRLGITLNDVVELHWVNGGEKYFYAKNFGLVAWERIHQDPHTPQWTAISELVHDDNNNVRMRGCFG